MKIIDNKKDYYDYISGINGIDDLIIYDRRKSIVPGFFELPIDENHRSYCDPRKLKDVNNKNGEVIIVEAGLIKIFIKYRYYREAPGENYKVQFEYLSETPIRKEEKRGLGKVSIFQTRIGYSDTKPYEDINSSLVFNYSHEITDGNQDYIWKDTWISKVIPAETIWQGIYAFISSKKDKTFKDSRNDIQKLESAGFDKKTSFRKM